MTDGWRPLDEPGSGGWISAVAVSPMDPRHILVAGDMLGVGISRDGGASWASTTGFSSWEINDFTFAPGSDDVVWVGTLSGPYRSTDGGRTWTPMRGGLPIGDFPYSAPIQKVLIDASDAQHLVALGGNQRGFVSSAGALNFGAVYESQDGGRTWSPIGSVGLGANVRDVVAAGGDLRTLYAAVAGHGVMVSTDGGRTWSDADAGLPSPSARGLAIDPIDSSTLWVAMDHSPVAVNGRYAPGGIYKTVDGGAIWRPANVGLPRNADATATYATAMYSVFRAGDGALYTADQGYRDQTRYRSTDGGETWTSVGRAMSHFYPAEATPSAWSSSADGSLVVGGTSDTLMVTRDRGGSWSDLGATQVSVGAWRGTGFSGLVGTRVAFSGKVLLLTAMDAGLLLRSDDGGASWTRPAARWDSYGGGYDVAIGGTTGMRAYAVLGQSGTFNGLASSSDAGKTWSVQAGGPLPARGTASADRGAVAIGSSDGLVAYAVLPTGGLYRTADGGGTWRAVPAILDARAVAAAPGGTLAVSTGSGVFISSDGTTFARVPGAPANVARLVASRDGTFYAVGALGGPTASAGLWRLNRATASQLSANRWVSDVAVSPADDRQVVFVTNDQPYHDRSSATGVWTSADGGRTFAQLNDGLAMLRVESVAFDPSHPSRLVIGTNGRGFWTRALG